MVAADGASVVLGLIVVDNVVFVISEAVAAVSRSNLSLRVGLARETYLVVGKGVVVVCTLQVLDNVVPESNSRQAPLFLHRRAGEGGLGRYG